ncbi:LytR family transcriptional regulator [Streptococcus oricebi]|uniref:Regulatory protein MsrR n=1 Tax=Streptococcus oricebi TaxID=1547447 RepID=A0ABS5B2J0_9STRE|nr:LCP family protein [Streptococcus oricebi]MBP2623039.1 LytR family transcriptional regulator [Streptococcus oricebi]
MTKNSGNLSHHEELRLDYLYKNYHYLNDREKQEYDYLLRKKEGKIGPTSSSRTARPASPKEQLKKQPGLTDEGLPKYPERQSRSQARRKTSLKKEQEPLGAKPQGPRKKKKWNLKRILKWVGLFLLLVLGGMLFMFLKGLLSVTSNPNAKPAQVETFNGQDTKDGVNILILGTDGRIGQTSDETRTDTIMVVNVGNKDKKIKMVSFMRDTLVHIDGVSQEDSYNTYYDQKLNSAYTIGEQNKQQGAELVREMLKDNFDIDIKYYAMVDFSTFATAIDTLFPNGVAMDAKFSTIDGEPVSEVEVPDDLNMKDGVVPNQTIKVGQQRMDGRTLLNYARFRKDDEGDFGRTRRQQEVMTAVLQQVKDPTKLFTGSEALGKVFGLTSTNIPYTFLLTNGLSTITSAKNGIERVTVPEYGDWVDDFDMYGGQGLLVDFEAYKNKLAQLGLR